MSVVKILADFDNIGIIDKEIFFSYKGNRYTLRFGINPNDKSLIGSISKDSERLITNKTIVEFEYIIDSYGNTDIEIENNVDFYFYYSGDARQHGNKIYEDDFTSALGLYMVDFEEEGASE